MYAGRGDTFYVHQSPNILLLGKGIVHDFLSPYGYPSFDLIKWFVTNVGYYSLNLIHPRILITV